METVNIILGLIFIIFFIITLSIGFFIDTWDNRYKILLWVATGGLALIFLVCGIVIFTTIDLVAIDPKLNNFITGYSKNLNTIKNINETQNKDIEKNTDTLKSYNTMIESNLSTIESLQNTVSNTMDLVDSLEYSQGPQGPQGPQGASWGGSLIVTEGVTRSATEDFSTYYIANDKVRFPETLTIYNSSDISYNNSSGVWTLAPNALYEINYVINCTYDTITTGYALFHIGNGSVSDTVYTTGWLDGYGTINTPTASTNAGSGISSVTITYSTYDNNPLSIYLALHETSGGCRILKESRMTVIKLN